MNLHGVVRGAIQIMNKDRPALYLKSLGSTVDGNFNQVPSYATGVAVRIQVQPLAKEEQRHVDRLNMTGVYRTVYMYGNTQGIVRVQAKGGDLIQTRPFQGEAVQNWLVVEADGPWNVENGGWTKLLVVLQTDTPVVPAGSYI